MGGRWIVMKVVEPVSIPGKQGQSVVRSTCYVNAEKQEDIFAEDMDGPAVEARITITLLLTCRQVYIEALPILHQRNTFCFPAEHFGVLFFSPLGRSCLQSIRHLSLYVPYQDGHSYHFDTPWTWKTVFPILKEIHIQSLELGFGNNTVAGSGPFKDSDAVLRTVWGHSVLEIRGPSHFQLSLNFDDEVPPARGKEIEQRFQQLMIGPGADERYAKFLEEWETSWKV
ncbi:hypothetical protein C8R45DRAFT_932210 [Mycena sanguinolenta]|nr:hypothetical protein C8R45DRAFT_932210 [Mycena sanguinolenta]